MTAGASWPELLALAGALLSWSPTSAAVGRRARRLVTEVSAAQVRGDAAPLRAWVLAGAAGLGAALLLGGVAGLLAAGVVILVARRLLHGAPFGGPDEGGLLRRELPGACDLLAVCLAAGVPIAGALAAVGAAVPAPLGPRLQHVAALYRLGAEPRPAWADVPAELAALGRVLVRGGESGSSVVPALRSLATEGRAAARAGTEAAVRRAGIWVLAPLGLCFLPAFVCLGVAPLILGIAGEVFP